MGRIAIWIANGALFVLCCFLVASTVNQFIAAAIVPDPTVLMPSESDMPQVSAYNSDPLRILKANPFSGSVALPDVNVDSQSDDENLPATKLSLRLLGTLATGIPETSFAAVEETDNRQSHVVTVNDRLKSTATIVAIERRRIVLDNAGIREELVLEENKPGVASAALHTPKPRGARKRRTRPTPRPRPAMKPSKSRLSPAELLKQAKIVPKFENGTMIGMEVNDIQDDSLFDRMGINNGDIVTEFNGVPVSDTKKGLDMLRQLTTAGSIQAEVQSSSGGTRNIDYQIQADDR